MLPTQEFSENVGPPWTPPVWTEGPDGLIAQAKSDLFQTDADIGRILSANEAAMSGTKQAPQNESDQVIPADASSNNSRSEFWQSTLNELRKTAPLAGMDNPNKPGGPEATPTPNPNA
jgi:hypothetical protein